MKSTVYCYERYEMLSDPIFLVNTRINIDFLSPFSQWEFEKHEFRPIRDRERDDSFKSIWQSSTMKIRTEWQVAALMCLGEQCKSNCDKTDKQSNIQILLLMLRLLSWNISCLLYVLCVLWQKHSSEKFFEWKKENHQVEPFMLHFSCTFIC